MLRSFRNVSTSSIVEGKPIRSNESQRISVRRSASRVGSSLARRIRRSTKRSIGFRDQVSSTSVGGLRRFGGMKDQCRVNSAPSLIHAHNAARSAAESDLLLSGGGILSSASSASIRRTNSLSSGLPGTIARLPESNSLVADSNTSSRRPASRSASSGP